MEDAFFSACSILVAKSNHKNYQEVANGFVTWISSMKAESIARQGYYCL